MNAGVGCRGSPIERLIGVERRVGGRAGEQLAQALERIGPQSCETGVHVGRDRTWGKSRGMHAPHRVLHDVGAVPLRSIIAGRPVVFGRDHRSLRGMSLPARGIAP